MEVLRCQEEMEWVPWGPDKGLVVVVVGAGWVVTKQVRGPMENVCVRSVALAHRIAPACRAMRRNVRAVAQG